MVGFSNAYLINTTSELAIRYNDMAVLENHHASICFTLMNEPEVNLLQNFTKKQIRECRQSIIQCIIFTDMNRHSELIRSLKEHYELSWVSELSSPVFSGDSKDHRLLLRNTIIHCADCSNAVLPELMYRKWATLFFQEMFEQSEMELKLGIPSHFKIDKPSEKNLAIMQVNLLNYVIVPLWDEFTCAFKDFLPQLERIRKNKEIFVATDLGNTENVSTMVF